ncbi:hypothetical protein J8F10_17620 [Gemmata sp. G18]|uniref:site-specific DNA-methyltransferase (adenine-specific) n=1 Tax=Gemmata palustris TaxID=2822762 RepID=A0ABS5BW20_9BACT|nr:TaqI-like C-terminal specificity domain-containing protein [Gemmata palustris]MBP3957088.1 hypothetical protein [Gemmata palustris]
MDDLSQQIADEGVAVPRSRFGTEPWSLEPPGATALMDKIRAAGVPLREFIGAEPLSGIKTGLNEAFLLDNATKDKLVAADLKSADLCKPYLRGQDNSRWNAGWVKLWMLALKSSNNHEWPWSKTATGMDAEAIFRQTYPAVHAHLNQFRDALIKRQDQGEHWWELRSCAYWNAFEKKKLIYPEITWRADWNFDSRGLHINNTVYILPTEDLWVLAVMNAPVMWAYCWRNAQHGKDEALRFIREFVQTIPIPKPTDGQRAEVEAAVGRLIELACEQQGGRAAILDWLRSEFNVEKASQKLQVPATLSADAFVAEVKKESKKGFGVAELKRLKDEYGKSVLPLHALAREAEQLERQVSDVVNAAFGLTPDEVKLMWDTAPPRMPIARPPGA